NAVPLDGAGAAGAKFEFTATNAAGALYLSNLKIVPGPSGVYVDHPIFVSVPATGAPKLDPLDRYQGMKFNLGAGAAAPMQTLGNGTASFPAFSATDPLAIYAREVGAMKP
ncbi:MAG TPA: hypothetical protein VK427_08190, partial [Kofleriaceae bacterium]|nr:hypothetical protein [Kofleriaceae bacterium]